MSDVGNNDSARTKMEIHRKCTTAVKKISVVNDKIRQEQCRPTADAILKYYNIAF